MAEVTRYIIKIDADLFDLAPVLMESLCQELKEIQGFTVKGDFEQVREKAHSSRGAALTFGFDVYAFELMKITEAAKAENVDLLQSHCRLLKVLLDNVDFKVG